MTLSRRQLLRGLGTGIVGASATPSIAGAGITGSGDGLWSPEEIPGSGGPIRLHRNENPYGASRAVRASMQKGIAAPANRYLDAAAEHLRSAIAAKHRVPTDYVVLSCGSREVLRAAANAQSRSRGKLVAASPTFEWFTRYVRRFGTKVATVPLSKTHAHDLDAMLARSADATLVYICNPNNPTGTTTSLGDLEAFVGKLPATTCVLIDEAYHHYVAPSEAYGSFLDRPVPDARVVVTRSFSKIHGLAGLRIGYAVVAPEMARRLHLHELEEGVTVVSATAALVALFDDEHVRSSQARTADDRQEFFNEANARMLRVIDSQTNFVMLNTARPAAPVVEHLRKHNIVVPPPFAAFDNYIRVSLGTPDDMRAFWRAWDLLPGGGHGHGTAM